MIRYRFATLDDVLILAHMNRQLVEDEGHRNRFKPVSWFVDRMRGFLTGNYHAVLFEVAGETFATTAEDAVAAAVADGARTVVLVGRDDTYAELAADVVAGLDEAADPPVVMLAGSAPEGVDVDTISIKSNVLETLGRLADRVGGGS